MEFLSQRGIAFEARNVREDSTALQELLDLGSRSTPTILVDGEVMIGFDPQRLLKLAQRDA